MKAALFFSAFLLAACGIPGAAEEEGGASYRIGPDGAAGLKAQTPFTLPALERAFPGLDVVSLTDAGQPLFHIREKGSDETLFIVTPDWTRGYAGAVTTRHVDVAGPDGLRIGHTVLHTVPHSFTQNCAPAPTPPHGFTCESASFLLEFSDASPDAELEAMTYLPPLP